MPEPTDDIKEQLLALIADLEEERRYGDDGETQQFAHPDIGLRYFDGGAEVDLRALADRIIEAGWRPSDSRSIRQ